MPIEKDSLDSLRIDRDARPASGTRRGLWLGGVVGAVVAVVALFWFWRTTSPEAPLVQTAIATRAGPATAENAVLQASGYVVARRLATISSKVTGRIAGVLVEEGMTVETGQVLARLDDATAQAQLALAESQLRAERDAQNEVGIRLQEARRTLERRRSLRADSLVSEEALDEARSEVEALGARLDAGRSDVAVADRNVALRAQDVEDLIIRSPFAGVVVSKDAQPGEMISPVSAGGGFTRTGICTIVDMASREIEVDVNEAYINRVYDGQRTIAQLDAYSDWDIPSSVINIVPTADRQRATVRVRIAFDALDARILPDMGVRVRFLEEAAPIAEGPKAVAAIPPTALRRDGDKAFVWVVRGETLERRAVRVGRERQDAVELVAGIAPGEVVVTEAAGNLQEGLRIRPN